MCILFFGRYMKFSFYQILYNLNSASTSLYRCENKQKKENNKKRKNQNKEKEIVTRGVKCNFMNANFPPQVFIFTAVLNGIWWPRYAKFLGHGLADPLSILVSILLLKRLAIVPYRIRQRDQGEGLSIFINPSIDP